MCRYCETQPKPRSWDWGDVIVTSIVALCLAIAIVRGLVVWDLLGQG